MCSARMVRPRTRASCGHLGIRVSSLGVTSPGGTAMLKRFLSLAVLLFACASSVPVGTPAAGAASGDTGWKVLRTAYVQLVTNVSDEGRPGGAGGAGGTPGHRARCAVAEPSTRFGCHAQRGLSRQRRGSRLDVRRLHHPLYANRVLRGPADAAHRHLGSAALGSYRSGAEPHSWVFIPMKGVVWQLGRQLDPHAPPWLLLGLGENLVPFAHQAESDRVGMGEVNRSDSAATGAPAPSRSPRI